MRAAAIVLLLAGASSACKKSTLASGTDPADPTPACKAVLTSEQQRAFDDGLASLGKADHVLVSSGEPTITFYRSDGMFCTAMASRCAVADAFASQGKKALDDPSAAVRRILLDFRDRPQPGILHAKADWYAQKVDDMTDDQFTMYVGRLMGDCSAAAGYGFLEARVGARAGVPASNHLIVYVGRVLEELRRVESTPSSSPAPAPRTELLKPILKRMAKGEISGAMWAHPPEQRDRDLALGCIDRGDTSRVVPGGTGR